MRFDLDDFEVAIRDGRRFVRRLQAVEVGRAEDEASITVPGVGGRYRAGLAHTGLLDSVELRQIPAVIPAAGQVEIEVHAAGLNFKDVVNGMGVLPSRAVRGGLAGDELGLEVAGRVVATGADVTDFQPGDRVMARVAHGFAGRVIADRHCVTSLPECIGMVEGRRFRSCLTAYYGLRHLGRLGEGETVLRLGVLRDSRFCTCIEQARRNAGRKKSAANLVARLTELDEGEKVEPLCNELAAALGRILDLDASKIDTNASIDKLSLDSLMLNQLRNWILRNVDVNLPLIKLLKGPSVREIAVMSIEQCDGAAPEDRSSAHDEAADPAAPSLIEQMGVEEVSPWLLRGRGDARAPTRVFCFHSMGVGASLFTRFLREPPHGCDLFAAPARLL